MPKAEEIYKTEGLILVHRPKAVLVEINDEKIWLPRSQLIDDDQLPESGHAEIKMTAWIAKEKGII